MSKVETYVAKNEARLNNKQILALIGVLFTAFFWGFGFVVMKTTLDALSPLYILCFRFIIGGIGMLVFFFPKVKEAQKSDFLPGCVVGVLVFLAYVLQTYGLMHTTASNNAFLTTFYVILVPFINVLINRKRGARLRIVHVLASLIAVFGIGLLSLTDRFTMRFGDVLTLLCSLVFTFHIAFLDRYTAEHDPIILNTIQIVVCAVLSFLGALIFEGPPPVAAVFTYDVIISLAQLGLISTMLCFLFQIIGQKYLAPTLVSITLSLECVFGAVFSILILGDPLTVRILAGFSLMFCAVIFSILSGNKD